MPVRTSILPPTFALGGGSSIGIRTLTDMILSHMPLPIGLWSHLEAQENYDISTYRLTVCCSASELLSHMI